MTDSEELDFDSHRTGRRVVYVVDDAAASGGFSVDLRELWRFCWRRKGSIALISAFFTCLAIVYALLSPRWYQAEVLLASTDEQSFPSIGEQLGGLAALAGVSVGGGDSSEAVAILESRDFIRTFISENDLVSLIYNAYSASKPMSRFFRDSDDQPDIEDAVKFFISDILRVDEDRQTGLVTLAVEWTDAEVAAIWANELVGRLNEKMRLRALRDAEFNISFLQEEIEKTNLIPLQQSIGRLLESEMQKAMLARGNEEFQFRVIDSAVPPTLPSRPQRKLIVFLGASFGLLLAVAVLYSLELMRRRPIDQGS